MLAQSQVIQEVADCATWADRLIRADLIAGFVVTENDYTSNFTGALRREINSRQIRGLSAHTQVLTPRVERNTGTDACIILQNQTHFKIGLFEAKWPRITTHANYWDSIQKSNLRSHFDNQIAKQSTLSNYAVWEMFYAEESYGQSKLFPQYGSACVWHSDAFAISSARTQTTPWADGELISMLKAHGLGIGDIVTQICMCRAGQLQPLDSLRSSLDDLGIKGRVVVIKFDCENVN